MGRAWCYGDSVDTDVIIPARYLTTTDPAELAEHALEDLDSGFASAVQSGDVVVAGSNFGCGSSREHAPVALKGAGIDAVVARSFARIFFRNAINTGLVIVTCPELVDITDSGDEIEVDPAKGLASNITKGQSFRPEPLPDFILEIVECGGLVEWVKRRTKVA
ncbi:MAG: 3-isopropylmalate dehydratase small subunit [Actinomycetota bacterium]